MKPTKLQLPISPSTFAKLCAYANARGISVDVAMERIVNQILDAKAARA